MRQRRQIALSVVFVALMGGLLWPPRVAHAQKTDVILMRNGDSATGEMKWLDEGQLEFKTDAMSTVNVKWPRVLTVNTDKVFEITLADGTLYSGSLQSSRPGFTLISTNGQLIETPTQSIVRLHPTRPSFWRALDGNFDIGLGFTQQNSKTDLNADLEVRYPRKANLTKINASYAFSRQDNVDNILRFDANLVHARQFAGQWLYLGFLAGSSNTQLSLDARATVGGGLGRLLVDTNKLGIAAWCGPAYSLEAFSGQEGNVSIPIILAADFLLFIWDPLSTDITSQFSVVPIVNESGRWRASFNLSAKRELVKNFYIRLGVNELFDSKPPSSEAKRNDFSFTTSLGIDF